MSETRFHTLLDELFQGKHASIRSQLASLSSDERKALFKDFKGLLNVLRKATRYRFEAKPVKLQHLYKALQGLGPDAAKEKAVAVIGDGTLFSNFGFGLGFNEAERFFIRLQMLQVGLANKSGIATGFKRGNTHPVAWGRRYVLRIGMVLLDRPEPWVQKALLNVFENFDNWAENSDDVGIDKLLTATLEKHPAWTEAFLPYYGKALRWHGLQARGLENYDTAMILAALEYESPNQEAWQEPVLNEAVVKKLLRMKDEGGLPRDGLIEVGLRKLQSPLRPSIARGWIEFLGQLQLNDTDYEQHAEQLIDMLNAPAPAAAKFALDAVKTRFINDAANADSLLGPLGYILQHQTQTLAKAALTLIKKLVKAHPEHAPQALEHAVAALSSPHIRLRGDIIRWLAGFKPEDFDPDRLLQLQDMAALLPPSEIEPLRQLLPEAPLPDDEFAAPVDLALKERISTARDRLATQPDPLLKHRVAYLENYLAKGYCELQPLVPDHASILGPADFKLHESVEDLAADIARTRNRAFTYADFDRIFASMLKFPRTDDSERVDKILAPLLKRQDAWQSGEENFTAVNELPALILAKAWLGGVPLKFPKRSFGASMFASVGGPELQRRARQVRSLLAAGHDELLDLPTHSDGWLLPEVFAERLARYPRAFIDNKTLGAALYRLPMLTEQRTAAWERLSSFIGELNPVQSDALAVALAPRQRSEQALDRWLKGLQQSLPSEALIESGFNGGFDFDFGENLTNVVEKITGKSKPNNDSAFALFNAALRCRFDLNDTGLDARAPWLVEHFAGGWLNKLVRNKAAATQTLAAKLLFNPRPITAELIKALFPGGQRIFGGYSTSHPTLLAYTVALPQTYAVTPAQIIDYAYRYPILAQRLFEAGVHRKQAGNDWFNDLTLEMIRLGLKPQIDPRAQLEGITIGLAAHAKPQQRERYVDLLVQWLADGRATPATLAAALAARIRATDKGFSYLDQALASIAACGAAQRATVQLAIELVLSEGSAELTPKKLSTLLDRLADVVENGSVHDSAAHANLSELAQAKKRSVARDKARALVNRADAGEPPEVIAVAALLE